MAPDGGYEEVKCINEDQVWKDLPFLPCVVVPMDTRHGEDLGFERRLVKLARRGIPDQAAICSSALLRRF